MIKEIQYSDEPLGEIRIISDFLPSPEEMNLKSDEIQVTMSLSADSIAYFEAVAQQYQIHYQAIIRQLLDEYVARQVSPQKIVDRSSSL